MGVFWNIIIILLSSIYIFGVYATFKETKNKFTKLIKIFLLSIFWPMFLFSALIHTLEEYEED
jgi:hypothetical protein